MAGWTILHAHTAVCLFPLQHLRHKLSQATVHQIVREAVELEREFCCEALSCALVGMNAGMMSQYIEFVADRLLLALGHEKLYHSVNPFDWMEMISLQVRCGLDGHLAGGCCINRRVVHGQQTTALHVYNCEYCVTVLCCTSVAEG